MQPGLGVRRSTVVLVLNGSPAVTVEDTSGWAA